MWRSHTNKVKAGARFSFSKRHKKRQKDKENGNFTSKQKNGLKNRHRKESKGDEIKEKWKAVSKSERKKVENEEGGKEKEESTKMIPHSSKRNVYLSKCTVLALNNKSSPRLHASVEKKHKT